MLFWFCKQQSSYEMRINDWSSGLCSSDLQRRAKAIERHPRADVECPGLGIATRRRGRRGRNEALGQGVVHAPRKKGPDRAPAPCDRFKQFEIAHHATGASFVRPQAFELDES